MAIFSIMLCASSLVLFASSLASLASLVSLASVPSCLSVTNSAACIIHVGEEIEDGEGLLLCRQSTPSRGNKKPCLRKRSDWLEHKLLVSEHEAKLGASPGGCDKTGKGTSWAVDVTGSPGFVSS